MSVPGSFAWLARHEIRLSWRDWAAMMTGGRPRRWRIVATAIVAFVILLHLIAWSILQTAAGPGIEADRATLIVVTGTALLSWSLMLSQAIEMVTRAFYSRGDLDLVLSSPVSAARVFAVRICAIAATSTFMAIPMAGPFINALAWVDGLHWLGAYPVLLAMGASATALSIALTVGLFATLGPKRTRFVAQVVAAIVGATFVIGIQAAAIFSTGTLSRIAALQSPGVVAMAPGLDSPFWWPARAMMGELPALFAIVAIAAILLAAATYLFAPRFAGYATAASGISAVPLRQRRSTRAFRTASPGQMLRRKEWILLKRDPWLVSQTLIQILYLLPPALLLWRNFSAGQGALVVLVPVIVMAAGQLAGGLAWLAVSGEDAPDLVDIRSGRGGADRAGEDRGGDRPDRAPRLADDLLPAARIPLRCDRVDRRSSSRGGVRDADPALVPNAGQAQPIPPAADLFPDGDVCGSLLVDRLGGDRVLGRCDFMARTDSRDRRRGRARGRTAHPSAVSTFFGPFKASRNIPASAASRDAAQSWQAGHNARESRGNWHRKMADCLRVFNAFAKQGS